MDRLADRPGHEPLEPGGGQVAASSGQRERRVEHLGLLPGSLGGLDEVSGDEEGAGPVVEGRRGKGIPHHGAVTRGRQLDDGGHVAVDQGRRQRWPDGGP